MPLQNRRKFLKTSVALAGGTFAISGTKSSGNILGANERIRIAIAGLHGRGKSHMSEFAKMKDVEIVYLVDPDTRQYANAVKRVKGIAGNTPKTVPNIKTALNDRSVDAISIATPNHWHSLMTIWGCQHEKDVYVEKPCSHNVHEGRVAVQAARKHKRIVQHGTQGRSSATWAKIVEAIKSGKYGKLRVARGLCYKKRGSIKFKKPQAPPAGMDFNLWLGPAADQPYHENLVHYNWHWFWDFGNGDIGNQGVHQLDVARWGIPNATLPKKVISVGGRLGYKDQGETANTLMTIFDFGETQLIFEVRGLVPRNRIDDMFHFDGGTIRSDGKFYAKNDKKGELITNVKSSRGPGGGNHFANFIAAVKSRDSEDLNADILEGHYSSALGHLANVSYRLGEEGSFSKAEKTFTDNKAAADTFDAMEEHLTERGVKLDTTQCRLGRVLKVDAKTESIVGDKQANAMLTREYRKEFEVPEKIA
jgi:predicted dehydrogenase